MPSGCDHSQSKNNPSRSSAFTVTLFYTSASSQYEYENLNLCKHEYENKYYCSRHTVAGVSEKMSTSPSLGYATQTKNV